jgi:hypothetical protein
VCDNENPPSLTLPRWGRGYVCSSFLMNTYGANTALLRGRSPEF